MAMGACSWASAAVPRASKASSCTAMAVPRTLAELEKLSQHSLVQMLESVVEERDAAVAERATLEAQAAQLTRRLKSIKKDRYLVDPPLIGSYADMDNRKKTAHTKWAPRTTKQGWIADKSHQDFAITGRRLAYNAAKECFALTDSKATEMIGLKDVKEVISSALLLYRLCILYEGMSVDVRSGQGENKLWASELVHVSTGEALGFSEWKGGALVRVSNLDAPDEFMADMLELLNLVCEPDFPHNYESRTAGSFE